MKLDEYDLIQVVTCLPVPVRKMLVKQGKSLFVAGGFIRAVVANERWNDIDLFCQSKEVGEVLAKSLGHVHETDNAFSVRVLGQQVQFIHRWTFDDPVKCIDSFDFTIAKCAVWYDYDAREWKSVCSDSFYVDLAAKRLVYCAPVRAEEAGGSMLRVLKFYQRGYRIPLESLGRVISRLMQGVDWSKVGPRDEDRLARILAGLLYEVDPNSVRNEYFTNDTSVLNEEQDGSPTAN